MNRDCKSDLFHTQNITDTHHTEKGSNVSAVVTHSEHVRVDVGRVHQSRHRLHKDEESDDHQEEAVDEAREDFHTAVPASRRTQGGALTTSTMKDRSRGGPFRKEPHP